MKKAMTSVLAMVLAAVSVAGATFAADEAATPYSRFEQTVVPLREQLYEKKMALDGLYRSNSQDEARKQALIGEIGDLQARLYAARSQFHAQIGTPDNYGGGYAHHGWRGGRGNGGGHWGGGWGGGCRW